MKVKGAVAAGHEETAQAAAITLREGGNAFDAVVAAHLAACVVEPVLASLGGGSFLLARSATGRSQVFDFFVQTPKQKRLPDDVDFRAILADFGTAQQEFHIGWGAVATPGVVRGLFAIHRELCSMPMTNLAAPAIKLAREGVVMNAFQASVFKIVHAIYTSSASSRRAYASPATADELIQQGERLRQPELADCIEAIAREGEALFYEGEIAKEIAKLSVDEGGHLTKRDLQDYAVLKREPLAVRYRSTRLHTNPSPSAGGLLIAFALKLLETSNLNAYTFGTSAYLDLLARVLNQTNKARVDAHLQEGQRSLAEHLLDREIIERYRKEIHGRSLCSRGTTHMSVMDSQGNVASLSTSNGEGCGFIVPGTGIMLNNMLGEEDLNPLGFHQWGEDQRMISMLAPTFAFDEHQRCLCIGSGGSNRLRTAILQVLVNTFDFSMPLAKAVASPRIHDEAGHLSVEGGFDEAEVQALTNAHPDHHVWAERSMFFGGTHCVWRDGEQFSGVGDPRRDGAAIIVT